MVADSMVRRVRKSGKNPAQNADSSSWPWLTSRSGGFNPVTDESALSLTAFYRGIQIIAGTLGNLPLHIYEEQEAGGTRIQLHTPDTYYLRGRPNLEMRRKAFWTRVIADEVRGNAFIFVEKDRDGGPRAIWYIDRHRVRVGRTSEGRKVYELDNELPMVDYRDGGEIVHIPNWGNALVGYDPVRLANMALNLSISAQEYAMRSFTQGQVPPGLITSEQVLTEDQANEMASMWEKMHAGLANMHKIAVLGSGAKFQQTSVDLDKMQMEALRRFQVQEVARLLGIPPHLLAEVTRTTSWGSGIEEQNRGLWSYTLLSHIGLIEEAIDDDLLVKELTGRFCKFDPDGLLRAATLQRYQAYRLADFMTINEKRRLEELDPIVGGDEILQQSNQAPLDAFDGMKLGQGQPVAALLAERIEVLEEAVEVSE